MTTVPPPRVTEIDLDHPPASLDVLGDPLTRAPREPWSLVRKLTIVAVVTGLIAALLAGRLYVIGRQTDAEVAAAQTIAAYTAAWNAHDVKAIEATMTDDSTFVAGENLERPLVNASSGPELEAWLERLFAADVSLRTRGPLTVSGRKIALHVTVPQRFSYQVYGLDAVEDGMSLFTLIDENGTFKIRSHVWWRPVPPGGPSMLWIE